MLLSRVKLFVVVANLGWFRTVDVMMGTVRKARRTILGGRMVLRVSTIITDLITV